jgi:general secretion pathway protein K
MHRSEARSATTILPPNRPAARGIALVVVLWMLSLLMVIVGSFVLTTRTEVRLAANHVDQVRVEAVADAGIQRAIFELYRPDTEADKWRPDGRERSFTLDGATVRVVINAESGKIDLNWAAEPILKGVFRVVGVPDSEVEAIIDAIQDWRDADDFRRLHGAEAADYESAGLEARPANAPFMTIEELRSVKGVTGPIYNRVAGAITVYSRQQGVDALAAPRLALLALPGADPILVDTYIDQRKMAIEQGLLPPPFLLAQAFAATSSSVFNIQATAELPDGIRFIREAVIRKTGNPRIPIQTFVWRAPGFSTDNVAADATATAPPSARHP